MLNKEVFKHCVQDLIDFYPHWGIRADNSSVMAKWYSQFQMFEDHTFLKGVRHYIKTESYTPTVAGLQKSISKFKGISNEYVRGCEPAQITEDDF